MTIYDIAKEVGVSASTVSRVINERPGIKPETRQRVMEALEKHNYYPDKAAQALSNQASQLIGILVSDIRISHHAEGAYYIQRRLSELGYSSIIFNTGTAEESMAECIRQLASHHVEAITMIGSVFETDTIQRLITKYLPEMPVVISNGYLELPNVYGVLSDEQGGVESCVRLLHGKGRRCLAFINDTDTISNRRKQYGFEAGVRALYPEQEPTVLSTVAGTESLRNGYQAVKELMKTRPETDGIIFATDLCAAGGLQALLDLGITVPEQVALVGVDNSTYAMLCRPQLTSLNNQIDELSKTCADMLAELVCKHEPMKKCLIHSEIVERSTT